MATYKIPGLEEGIRNCNRNIKSLEKALAHERKTKADYKVMIEQIKDAEELKAEAEAGVTVEVVRDGGSE